MEDFEAAHRKYVGAWNYGWKTGDPGKIIPFISRSYFGTWCSHGMDSPEMLDYRKLVDQIGPAISKIPGAIQAAESLITKKHGDSEVILGYLKKILDPQTLKEASSIQIEVWKNDDGEWRLAREYVEV